MEQIDQLYDQRNHRRVQLDGWARINFDGYWHNCRVIDLSGGGACLSLSLQPPLGSEVLFQMRGVGILRASLVHRGEKTLSLQFYAQDYDSEALVDSLMLPANQQLLKTLRRESGITPQEIVTPQEPIDDTLPPFEPDPSVISGAALLTPLAENDPSAQRDDSASAAADGNEDEGQTARRHPMRSRLFGRD